VARPATSPDARLRKLKAALPKAQDAGKGGRKLTAVPMHKLLGVTWPTLRGWCEDLPGFAESGAFIEGGNGIEWEFKPVATTRFLIGHFESEIKKRRESAKQVRKIIAGDALEDAPEDYDLDQLQKMLRLSRELREERAHWGKLVDAEEVHKLLSAMFAKMQATATKAISAQDPTNRLPPEHREKLEDAFANVLETMLVEGEKVLGKLSGGAAKP